MKTIMSVWYVIGKIENRNKTRMRIWYGPNWPMCCNTSSTSSGIVDVIGPVSDEPI